MELFAGMFNFLNRSDFIDTGDILVHEIGSVVKFLRLRDWCEEFLDFAVNG